MGSSPSRDKVCLIQDDWYFFQNWNSSYYLTPVIAILNMQAYLAQLVERKTFNLVVVGSSPTEGTRNICSICTGIQVVKGTGIIKAPVL